MIKKIYKGGDVSFELSELKICDYDGNKIELDSIDKLLISFYTDATDLFNYIIFNKENIIDNTIKLDNASLDNFNEGILKYNIKIQLKDNKFDIVHEAETNYYICRTIYSNNITTLDNYYTKGEVNTKINTLRIDCGEY